MIDKGGNPANNDYSSSLDAELIQDLAKKNYVLQQQVYEMEVRDRLLNTISISCCLLMPNETGVFI